MKIVIPGGSGQVGRFVARRFAADGHEVVVLSRNAANAAAAAPDARGETPWRTLPWDGRTMGPWTAELDGADVVLNLAGRSVNCRYHAKNRRQIMDSRIDSTRVLGQVIAQCRRPPKLWLHASTATIYAHRYDAPNDDLTGIIGGNEPNLPDAWRFSYDVATRWEQTLDEADVPHTRRVKLRMAIVMVPDRGGVFDMLLGMTRLGLGGTLGDGRQFVSWIHGEDLIRSLYWLIEHDAIDGPVNLAAPEPLPNREFARALREAWGIRLGLPATAWMLELAMILMRSETELVLKSRRVVPTRLLQSGFTFTFPTWPEAARDLCTQWRAARDA